jgi:hypothetical protein
MSWVRKQIQQVDKTLGLIPDYIYSAPYEDVQVKA